MIYNNKRKRSLILTNRFVYDILFSHKQQPYSLTIFSKELFSQKHPLKNTKKFVRRVFTDVIIMMRRQREIYTPSHNLTTNSLCRKGRIMKRITSIMMIISIIASVFLLSPTSSASEFLIGDCNGDGETNNKDVVALFRYVSGNKNAAVEENCDYNNDGNIDNKDVVALFRYISSEFGKCDHKYESEVSIEATCRREGEITYTCIYCGHFYYERTPKLKHNYVSETTKEPEYGKEGVRTYTCELCGDSYSESIPALTCPGHKYVETIIKTPTCTEPGEADYVCSVCGSYYTQALPMTEHVWGEWKTTKNPTSTEAGEKERACSECGRVEKAAIEATGETWDYYIQEGKDVETDPYCYNLWFTDSMGEPNLICSIKDYRTSWGERPEITRIGKWVGKVRWKDKDGNMKEKILDRTNLSEIQLYLYEDGTYQIYEGYGVGGQL